MSAKNFLILASATIALIGCSTTQESPIYQQSTQYKVHSPYENAQANNEQTAVPVTYATAAPTYQSTQNQTVTYQTNHACLDKEGDRKIIGTVAGGTVGAIAGHKLGDTKGAVAGTIIGGAAGYGIADKSIHCDPIQAAQPAPYQTSQTYPASTTVNAPGQIIHDATATEQMVYSQSDTASSAPTQAPTDSAYGDTFGTPGYHAMIANGELETPSPEPKSATVTSPSVATPSPFSKPVTQPQTQSQAQNQTFNQNQTGISLPSAPAQPSPQLSATGPTMHKVVEGDTVYSLSRRLCVDVEEIQQLNSINQEFYIRLDDYIKLPASRC